jgi:hypothetical protein
MQNGKVGGPRETVYRDLDVRNIGLGPDGKIRYMLPRNTSDTFRAELNSGGTEFTHPPTPISQRYENGTRFGRYSRDGKWAVYDTGWRGIAKIVAQNLETGEIVERVSAFGRVQSLEWFPDGSAVLVHGQIQGSQPYGFYRFDVKSGELKTVLDKGLGGDLATNPTFSPDGRYLYFKHWDTPEGFDPQDYSRAYIARLELATGQITEAFRPQRPNYIRHFAISPDMKQIVYGFRDPKRYAYAVAPLGGGQSRVIFECTGAEWTRGYSAVTFTGDGKGVVLHKVIRRKLTDLETSGEADELWHVPLDGGAPTLLHDTMGWTLTLAGRPNSREIMWQAARVHPQEFWIMENVTAPLATPRR